MQTEYQQCETQAQEVSVKETNRDLESEYINIDNQINRLEKRKKELKEKILFSCSLAECEGSKELELIKVCSYERETKQVDHEYLKEVLHPNQYRRAVKVLTSLVSKFTIKK